MRVDGMEEISRPVPPIARQMVEAWRLDPLQQGNLVSELMTIQYKGKLDDALLQRAFQAVVDRHETLRTGFHFAADTGEITARIHPVGSVKAVLDVFNLNKYTVDSQEVTSALKSIAQREFLENTPPLVRLAVAHVKDDRHVLVLAANHCALDGVSFGVFWKDLSAAYSNNFDKLVPLQMTYSDYAAVMMQALTPAVQEAQLNYWKNALAGAPELLDLPVDFPRPAASSYLGSTVAFDIDGALLDHIKDLMAREHQSLLRITTAAYARVLGYYTGQEEVVITVPRAVRPPGSENMIGHTVNVMPIRIPIDPKTAFIDSVKLVGKTIKEAVAHSDVPFASVVAACAPMRSAMYLPISQASISVHEQAWVSPPELPGLIGEDAAVQIESGRLRGDLQLYVRQLKNKVQCLIFYNSEILTEQTAQALGRKFKIALQTGVANPTAPVVLGLAEDEEERIIEFSIGPQRPEYLSAPLMHESFEAAAAKSPSSRCLCYEGAWMSYGEVEARASAAAKQLAVLGVGPGVVVGLMLDRSFELMISLLAVLKAGGCYLPCDPEYPDDRLQIYLEDGKAKVVLTQSQYTTRAGAMVDAGVQVIDVTSPEWQNGGNGAALVTRAGADDPAYIIFTSGSTGRPKGVQVLHRGLRDLMPWVLDMYQLGPKDVVIFNNTVNFDAHVMQILPPLCTGASLVIVKPKGHLDPGHVVDLVLAHTVTSFVVTVPTLAREYMAEFHRRKLPQYKSMRAWALGGDAMPLELVHQMQEFFPNLIPINAYGPTEVTAVTIQHLIPKDFGTVVIGGPDANVLAVVVDSALQPLPVGVPGELLLSGPRLALGYVGRADLTAEKFIPNPCVDLVAGKLHPALAPYFKLAYRTGDLVRWRSDGTLDFLGRIDRQVKITGVRIELGEVESALVGAPGVEQAQATALPDPQGQKRLVGYVTPASADPLAVLAHCRAQLVPAMVPSVVVALDAFPLLPNGKVDSKSLPAPEWGGAASEEYVAPLNDAEAAAQKVFAEVLGCPAEELSVLADFFAAGGTSLQVFRAAALLQSALGVASVPPTLVHTARTARAVAAELMLLKEDGGAEGMMTSAIDCRTWSGFERPLSANQEQMWLLSSLGSGAAYNMPLFIDLTSMPVVEALQAALDAVAARHEVLRTRFLRKPDGTVTGLVTPAESFHVSLQVIQVTSEKEVEAVAAAECDLAFDLEADPLLRAKLLERRRGSGAVLALTMHHAVGDAWSLGVFWKEVSEAYAAATRGAAPDWQPLPIQYADFAAWQEEQLSGECGAALRAYWKDELAGVPSVVQLPYDHPRPSHPSFAAGSLQVPLPPNLLQGVEEVSRQLRVNVQAVLLAALQTVLLRYSGQDDLVIGVPVAGRDRSETHGLVGYFINTLPIRCLANEDASFSDMISDASKSMLHALDHSLLPLESIVAVSGVGRVQNVNPLFQVLFQYMDGDGQQDGLLGDIKYTPLRLAKLGQAKLDLTTRVVGTELQMDFMSEVFEEATVRNMLNSYISILSAGVLEIKKKAYSLPLIDVSDERDVEALRKLSCGKWNWNPAHLEEPMITVALSQWAKSEPGRICLVFEGQVMTYGQLEARVTDLAEVLAGSGLQPGMAVGILLERSFELFIALMATLKSGGFVVPMDPAFPSDRLAMYAEDTQVHSIITTAALKSCAEDLTKVHMPKILIIDDGSLQNAPKGALPSEISPDSIAYVEFTSGSTGRPKGVIVQHHCLASYCASIRDMYSLRPDDCALLLTSINFDPFVRQTFLPLYIGARVVIARPGGHLDADYMMELAATHGVTIMHSVPTLALQYYAAPAAAKCTKLRYVGSGGEPLPQQLVDLVHTLKGGSVNLYNNYGPTECTVSCTCQIGVKPGDVITVGGPDVNMAAYVVDAHMQPVPVGVPGELLMSGPRLAQGYIGRPDLTAAAFIPNPLYELMAPAIPEGMRHHFTKAYRTGDLVRWRSDGTLVCMGRIDRQVKITGVRIELGEVEAALESAQGVTQAMAAAVPDANGQKKLVGYVTPESLDPGAVLSHCRSLLVPAMVPSAIVALDSFPLLPNGKVDVRSLPAPDWSFQANLLNTFGEDDGPLDEHSAAVVDHIRQVLGLDADVRVPLKAELFDLGATSVQIASLVGRIRKQMDVNLEMRQVYLNPQIEFLCKEVRKQKGDSGGAGGAANSKKPSSAFARHRPLGWPIAIWTKSLVDKKMPLTRAGTAIIQLISAMIVLAFQFGSIVPGVFVIGRVRDYNGSLFAALLGPIAFVMWGFTMLVFTFLFKWLFIGRYKPGTYPLWGWYYLRWWVVHRMVEASEPVLEVFVGTPLYSVYLRMMGASIGFNTQIYTALITEFDLISIGKGSTVGEDVMISGHSIERGYLVLGPIYIAEECSIGMLSVIMPHTSLDHNVALAPMSMVPLGSALPPMTRWQGSPVQKKEGSLLPSHAQQLKGSNVFSFRFSRTMSSVPEQLGGVQSVVASAAVTFTGAAIRAITSWLALLPVSAGTVYYWKHHTALLVLIMAVGFVVSFPLYMIQVVALKWLVLGRTTPGKYLARSSYAVRYRLVNLWFTAPLARTFCNHFNRTPIMPLTLRALGAKLGKRNIFYKMHPLMLAGADQLSFGDNVVIGQDALVLGGVVVADTLLIAETIVNSSAFVADGALVLPGSVLGLTSLVGVQTIIQPFSQLENGSVWAGSPALCLDPGIIRAASFYNTNSARSNSMRRLSSGSIGSKTTRWAQSQRLLAVRTVEGALSSRNLLSKNSSLLRGFSGLNSIGEDEPVAGDFTKQMSAGISRRLTSRSLTLSPFSGAPISPKAEARSAVQRSKESIRQMESLIFSQGSMIVGQLQEMQRGISTYSTLVVPCLLLPCFLYAAFIGPAFLISRAGSSSRTLGFCLVPVAAVVFCLSSAVFVLICKRLVFGRTQHGQHNLYGKWALIRSAALSSLFEISSTTFLNALMGTSWAGWYLNALGASIGKDVYLDGLPLVETDLLTLGDGVTVNRGAKIMVYNVENGTVECVDAEIAREVTLGPRAYVMPSAVLEERSGLGALSVAMKGETVDEGEYAEGYPMTHLGTWYDTEAPQPTAALDAAAVVEEMRRDAVLPADIHPAPVKAPVGTATPLQTVKPGPPEVVLLTGATGFVGGFILRELLRPHRGLKRVYCLVRCKSSEDGVDRIRKQLLHHELYTPSQWEEIAAPRLVVLPGDLGQPSLGLDASTMQQLADEVDVIINNGAMVNVTRGYAGVKTSNVDAVLELLRLSTRGVYAKPMHQISTGGALPRTMTGAIKEEYINPDPSYLAHFTGYDQSKWVAERLVLAAGQTGLYTAVQRLGRVGGDSTSGGANESDYCMLLIKGCLQMGCFPADYQFALNIIPGDLAAKVICDTALAVQGSTCGRTYHVTNPKPPPFQLAVDVLKQIGYKFEEVPYPAWRERLLSCAKDDNALRPLELAFGQEAPKKKAYTFDCTNSGIRGNTLSASHLKRDFEWCAKVGFFPPLPTEK